MALRPVSTSGTNGNSNNGLDDAISNYEKLVELGYPKDAAARTSGLDQFITGTPEDSQSVSASGTIELNRDGGGEKVTEATLKEAREREAGISSSRQALSANEQLLDAQSRINEANEDSIVKTNQDNILGRVARAIDNATEGVGVDLFAGTRSDRKLIDSYALSTDVAGFVSNWKGAISDYENKLFKNASRSSGADSEFNLNRSHVAMHETSMALLKATITGEYNSALGTRTSRLSTAEMDTVLNWLSSPEGGGMPIPEGGPLDYGSPEGQRLSKEIAQWVKNNTGVIREGAVRYALAKQSNQPIDSQIVADSYRNNDSFISTRDDNQQRVVSEQNRQPVQSSPQVREDGTVVMNSVAEAAAYARKLKSEGQILPNFFISTENRVISFSNGN